MTTHARLYASLSWTHCRIIVDLTRTTKGLCCHFFVWTFTVNTKILCTTYLLTFEKITTVFHKTSVGEAKENLSRAPVVLYWHRVKTGEYYGEWGIICG